MTTCRSFFNRLTLFTLFALCPILVLGSEQYSSEEESCTELSGTVKRPQLIGKSKGGFSTLSTRIRIDIAIPVRKQTDGVYEAVLTVHPDVPIGNIEIHLFGSAGLKVVSDSVIFDSSNIEKCKQFHIQLAIDQFEISKLDIQVHSSSPYSNGHNRFSFRVYDDSLEAYIGNSAETIANQAKKELGKRRGWSTPGEFPVKDS